MFGFLALNKPSGQTSRTALDVVQRIIRPAKVGHAGTLDPLAEGVLVACLGPATKLVRYVQAMPKTYLASFRLGLESDTEDIDGKVVALENARPVTAEELAGALSKFVGRIAQQPPIFSALRVKGKRAYQLARKGKPVDLQPRQIEIFGIDLVTARYPDFQLRIECGSGTYVRSLGRDIAKQLGTAAVMTGLIRTSIGGFQIERAISWEKLLSIDSPDKLTDYIIPPVEGMQLGGPWQTVALNPLQIQDLRHGRKVAIEDDVLGHPAQDVEKQILALDENNNLLAILSHQQANLHRSTISFMGYWDRN